VVFIVLLLPLHLVIWTIVSVLEIPYQIFFWPRDNSYLAVAFGYFLVIMFCLILSFLLLFSGITISVGDRDINLGITCSCECGYHLSKSDIIIYYLLLVIINIHCIQGLTRMSKDWSGGFLLSKEFTLPYVYSEYQIVREDKEISMYDALVQTAKQGEKTELMEPTSLTPQPRSWRKKINENVVKCVGGGYILIFLLLLVVGFVVHGN